MVEPTFEIKTSRNGSLQGLLFPSDESSGLYSNIDSSNKKKTSTINTKEQMVKPMEMKSVHLEDKKVGKKASFLSFLKRSK